MPLPLQGFFDALKKRYQRSHTIYCIVLSERVLNLVRYSVLSGCNEGGVPPKVRALKRGKNISVKREVPL